MTVEKLKMHSPSLTELNMDKLAEIFPVVVTEILDADGNPTRAVDFDALRQELADYIVEGPQERYRLDWPGKRAAAFAANAPIAKTLRPVREESVDFETTRNLFIEGDNLEVLKLLQESYLGKVKLIYIDPPYNTGNDFVYDDDFAESSAEYLARSNQTSESGDRLVANTESNGRFHSAWLSMIYPRLKLARALMSEDGIGFISIDANEVAQLKLLLAEVFGASNVVATIAWVSNLKGRQISDGGPAGTHEYILCFARNAEAVKQFRGSSSEFRKLMPDVYKGAAYQVKQDDAGAYVTKNELYNTNSKFNERTAPTMVFRIHYNPETAEVRVSDIDDPTLFPGFITAMPHANSRPGLNWHAWRWSRAKILSEHQDLEFDTSGERLRIRTKIRDIDGMTMKDIIIGPSTTTGQTDLEFLGLGRVFDTPKPVSLLETLVGVSTDEGDIVLDFFAGSSATAEAVLRRNALDHKARRFVMVQLGEKCAPGSAAAEEGYKTIAAFGRERLRRVAASLRHSGFTGDVGFRSLHVDTTNMAGALAAAEDLVQLALLDAVKSVKPDRVDEDLLFQVLLDCGLDLAEPITVEDVGSRRILSVAEGALIGCFDHDVSDVIVREIAKRRPLRAVFLDEGFNNDAARINAEQTFREISPETDVRAI